MKLNTHLVTGFCVATSLALLLGLGPREAVFSGILALAANYLIDALGHRGRGRAPFAHSLVGVTLVTIALFTALTALSPYAPIPSIDALKLFASSYAGALTHLLLDALTEGGVYIAYPFSRRRFAIAHLDYDNPVANVVASTLAIALLLYVAWIRYGHEVFAWFAK